VFVARTAIVVGGGLGGLTAAVALRRVGWDVTVLERAERFGEVGAGIVLFANALRCLDALDLGAALRQGGRLEKPGGLRTASGRWLFRIDEAALERTAGTTAIVMHRAELHRVLVSGLTVGSVVSDATPVAIDGGEDGGVVEVRYRHAGRVVSARAEVVVGADGLRSWVRGQRWPGAPRPVYAGSTAWRAVTGSPTRGGVGISQSWGPGQEFGILPLADDRVYWYAAATAPEGQRVPDELAALRHRFGAWHDPIPTLLAQTPAEAVLHHDVYELPPLRTYVRGSIVLLGDAAHAMTPSLGQGGGQAIEDATVLAAELDAGPDVLASLARYDRERRPRTQQISRASAVMGRFGQQLTNPVAVAVRNAAIHVTPPRVVLRSMTRFGSWTPPDLRQRPP
jgi:2-polyprenyl-6-methoxyphenol hydroxylase-like FAD-dependent oxidoreductase